MSTLRFRREDVEKLINHASACKKHRKNWGEKKGKPSLWLVHDDGVYLMSSGDPPLLEDPNTKDKENARSFVAQAEGTHPKKDENWWEEARALVGGDDFAEPLALKDCISWLASNAGRAIMELEFSETEIRFVGYKSRSPVSDSQLAESICSDGSIAK